MGLISRVSSRTYRFEFHPKKPKMPEFGATIGGFVKHHLAECQNSLHIVRGGNSSMLVSSLIFGVYLYNMPKRGGMRTVALPSKGGFISNTISKLPKQF